MRFGRDGVEVDEYLRTTNANIYAAGDVAFPQKFTHAAIATARLCAANALDGADRRARELIIPHCTYTDPEVAQVGLTPRQTQEAGIPMAGTKLSWPRWNAPLSTAKMRGLRQFTPVAAPARLLRRHLLRRMQAK